MWPRLGWNHVELLQISEAERIAGDSGIQRGGTRSSPANLLIRQWVVVPAAHADEWDALAYTAFTQDHSIPAERS
jgi:hypothetical protein